MKFKTIAVALLATGLATSAFAKPLKVMKLKYNNNVNIYISNVECPDKTARSDGYPWYAVAVRVDGDKLQGCYTGKDNQIVIQWLGGDKSYLSTDGFVPMPTGEMEEIKATL